MWLLALKVVRALQTSRKLWLTILPLLSLLHEIILYFFAFLFCCIITFNFCHFLRTYCEYYRSIVAIRLYCSAQAGEYSSIKPLGIIRVYPPPQLALCFFDYHYTYQFRIIWFRSSGFAPKKVGSTCPCVASSKGIRYPTLGVKYYSFRITHK